MPDEPANGAVTNGTARKRGKTAPTLTTAQQLGSLVKSARDIMRKDRGLSGDVDRLPLLTWIMFLKFLDDLDRIQEQEAILSGERFRPTLEPPYRWRDWAEPANGLTGEDLIAFINQDEAVRPDGTRGLGLFAYLRGLTGTSRGSVIASVFRGTYNRMVSGYLLREVVNKVDGIHFDSSEEIHTLGALYESMLKEMRDAAGDAGEFYTPAPSSASWSQSSTPAWAKPYLTPPAAPAASWWSLTAIWKASARRSKTAKPSNPAVCSAAKPSPCRTYSVR